MLQKNAPLSKITRIGIGGQAGWMATVTTESELRQSLQRAQQQHLPVFVLGKGSNVLINDEGFQGLVIRLAGDFKHITFNLTHQTVTAGGGTPLMHLGHRIAQNGFAGCTFLGVIPGTVGGAVRMNAGIRPTEEIQKNFLHADILDPATGTITQHSAAKMSFGYRSSSLSGTDRILLRATFRLPDARDKNPARGLEAIRSELRRRRAIQPRNPRTFGSTFKNPAGCDQSAGWYLEKVGMKEMRVGGAMVADQHANWILNMGNATARDVKALIETGQRRVFEKFGVALEREVLYIPADIFPCTAQSEPPDSCHLKQS